MTQLYPLGTRTHHTVSHNTTAILPGHLHQDTSHSVPQHHSHTPWTPAPGQITHSVPRHTISPGHQDTSHSVPQHHSHTPWTPAPGHITHSVPQHHSNTPRTPAPGRITHSVPQHSPNINKHTNMLCTLPFPSNPLHLQDEQSVNEKST